MSPTSKRILVAVAAIVVVIVLFFVLRRPAGGPDTGTGPSTSTPSAAPSAAPVSATPEAIVRDLTDPAKDIDHRVKKPEPALAAPALAFTYKRMVDLPKVELKEAAVVRYATVNQEYADKLARAYGISASPFIEGNTYVYTSPELGKAGSGILRVNGRSGFSSYGTIILAAGTGSVTTPDQAMPIARKFVSDKGQLPSNLAPPTTYKRKSLPGVTFVEFHKAWKPLPILETTGMLYASIADPKLNRPADADIVETADATDGLARPNDFNTITVAVDAKGRVLSADVNMRPEAGSTTEELRAPTAAWDDLVAGNGILGFVMPSSTNITNKNWEQIFPKGTATSSEARVREIILAYAEKPDNVRQEFQQPIYIFKGQAKLASGPLADFIVAVPALVAEDIPSSAR